MTRRNFVQTIAAATGAVAGATMLPSYQPLPAPVQKTASYVSDSRDVDYWCYRLEQAYSRQDAAEIARYMAARLQ